MSAQRTPQTPLPLLVVGLALLAWSCGNDRRDDNHGGGPSVSVTLSSGQAIDAVQRYLSQPDRLGTVRVPFTTTRAERVPCSAQEVEQDRRARPNNPELWTCRPAAPGSTSYVKTRTVTVRDCCQERRIRFPGGGRWVAERSQGSDAWRVKVEFSYENVPQEQAWSVDATGAVSESP